MRRGRVGEFIKAGREPTAVSGSVISNRLDALDGRKLPLDNGHAISRPPEAGDERGKLTRKSASGRCGLQLRLGPSKTLPRLPGGKGVTAVGLVRQCLGVP